jgi:transposase
MRVLPDPELTEEELQALTEVRDTDPRKSVRRRAQVILLAHKRFQGTEMARILDLTRKSVTQILKKWALTRMESVTRKKAKGQPPKLTQEHIQALTEWIHQDPGEYGYKPTTWTCKLLVDLLKKQFHVKLSQERLRQVLHARGLSYKKPRLQPPTASLAEKKSATSSPPAVRSRAKRGD